jgi:hypothetical protein
MTPETKERLDASALKSGRSQSAEIEFLIEQALAPYAMLEAMRKTIAEVERGNVEAAFRRLGFTPLHTSHGAVWLPPGYPVPRSGFIDQDQSESLQEGEVRKIG